jgi:FkbM family methyltransferase
MKTDELKYTEVSVRGVNLKLVTYTRSLELCARMNYETENLDFIDQIKPADILYDLGACEGRFSIYAAKKGVKVFSFEPEKKNFLAFTQNIHLNNLGEIVIAINAGVGSKNGKAVMQIGQPWEGGHQKVVDHGQVRNDLNFTFVESQQIDVLSLDSYVEKNPFPNYLKIDIDGSEIPFLDGASKTLDSRELRGIIFELNEMDRNFSRIEDTLKSKGFSEQSRYKVPNENNLYNIIYLRD